MNKDTTGGFLIIETLIAVVIFSLVAFSLFSTISYLQIKTQKSRYDAEASVLAQEATEIAYNALNVDWSAYVNDTYFPAYNATKGNWVLLAGKETDIKTRFTRYIDIFDVCRDSVTGELISEYENTGICSGTIDENSRIIQTTVVWQENDSEKSIVARLLTFNVPN